MYNRLLALSQPKAWVKANQKDSDLWQQVHSYLRQLGDRFRGVVKVVSHQNPNGAQTELEEWAFLHNEYADQVAQQALERYPKIVQACRQLQTEIGHLHTLREQTHRMYISTGKQSLQDAPTNPNRPMPAPLPGSVNPRTQPLHIPDFRITDMPRKYRCDTLMPMINWFRSLGTADDPVRLVSWYQLQHYFEHCTGSRGVTYVGREARWYTTETSAMDDLATRASSLAKFMKGAVTAIQGQCQASHVRSDSAVLTFWSLCLPLHFNQQRWDESLGRRLAGWPQLLMSERLASSCSEGAFSVSRASAFHHWV